MSTLTDISRKTTKGTAFLIEDSTPEDIFTPEDLSEEHLAIGRMVDEFWVERGRAESAGDPRKEAGCRSECAAEVSRFGFDGHGDS